MIAVLENVVSRLAHGTGSGAVFPAIDGLRAIAVLLVLGFHVHGFGAGSPPVNLLGVDLRPWLSTGFVGVDLFFVLSGFLLMLPWAKSHFDDRRAINVREFYWRRILRIVPAYYFHLTVLFAVLVPIAHSVSLVVSPLGMVNVAAHVTFTQYFTPWTSASFDVNGALWTLTLEACFYAILPMLAPFFLGRRAWLGLLAGIAISMLWRFLAFNADGVVLAMANHFRVEPIVIRKFLSLQFPGQFVYFAFGMAAASVYCLVTQRGSTAWWGRLLGSLGGGAGLSGLLLVAWLLSTLGPSYWTTHWHYTWTLCAAPTLAFLVLCAACGSRGAVAVLGTPMLRVTGLISYSMYLWHFPVIFFASRLMDGWGRTPTQHFWLLLLVCGSITVVIGYLSYFYIELPFLRRRDPAANAARVRAGEKSAHLGHTG